MRVRQRSFSPAGLRSQLFFWLCVLCLAPAYSQPYTFNVENDATQQQGPYYHLTEDVTAGSSRGAMWCTTPRSLDQPFDFTFFPNFGSNGPTGADGIAFVLQPIGSSGIQTATRGGDGRGIGYANANNFTQITPSLAVEIDTWWNGYDASGQLTAQDSGDSSNGYNQDGEIDHIDVIKNGLLLNNSLLPVNNRPVPAKIENGSPVNIEDGQCHVVRVQWIPDSVPSKCSLKVWFDGVLRVDLNTDIRSIFKVNNVLPDVYWGFTSASKEGHNRHYIAAYLDAGPDFLICRGDSATLGSNLSNDSGITYHWTGPNGFVSAQKSPSVMPTQDGENVYEVTMSYTNNTNPSNPVHYCDVSAKVIVTVEDPTVDAGPDEHLCYKGMVKLKAISNHTAGTTYLWTPATKLNCTTCQEPEASPIATTTYTVKATTPHGCVSEDQVTVYVGACPPAFETTFGQVYQPGNIKAADVICGAQIAGDCGYLISGMTDLQNDNSNFLLIKTHLDGSLDWDKVYIRDESPLTEQYSQGHFVQNIYTWTTDRPNHKVLTGYVVVGQSRIDAASGDDDITVFTTDLNGNLIKSKVFGTSGSDVGYHVIQTSDKNFLVTGYVKAQGYYSYNVFVAKLDANLNVIWSNTYDPGNTGKGWRAMEANDGYYYVVGEAKVSQTTNAFVMKLAPSNGAKQWAYTYGGSNITVARDIIQTYDGNFVIAGYTLGYNSVNNDAFVFKINSSGTPQWARAIASKNTSPNAVGEEYGFDIDEMNGSLHQLVLMVNSNFNTAGGGNFDACLVKLNKESNHIIWARAYATPEEDYADNLSILSDNTCAFVALTRGYDHPEGEILLVKTTVTGTTSCEVNGSFDPPRTVSPEPSDRTLSTDVQAVNLEITHQMIAIDINIVSTERCKQPIICEDPGWDVPPDGPKNLVNDPTLDNSVLCGTTDFSSQLVPYCNPAIPIMPNQYSLVNNVGTLLQGWVGTDHTGGTSKMLVGKGPFPTDTKVWYQNVPIQEDAMYTLCLQFRNVCPTCPERPDVEVRVDGELIGELEQIDASDGWVNITGTYLPESSGTKELSVTIKGNPESMAIALDDIYFVELSSSTGGMVPPQLSSVTEEPKSQSDIHIYPNPVKAGDILNLDYHSESNQLLHISVIDLAGKQVEHSDYSLQNQDNKITLPTSALKPGVYLVHMFTDSSAVTYKITVVE